MHARVRACVCMRVPVCVCVSIYVFWLRLRDYVCNCELCVGVCGRVYVNIVPTNDIL